MARLQVIGIRYQDMQGISPAWERCRRLYTLRADRIRLGFRAVNPATTIAFAAFCSTSGVALHKCNGSAKLL